MTILEAVALLVGAALGLASGALKAHLHSLRRPQCSLRAGSDGQGDHAMATEPRRSTGPAADERPASEDVLATLH